MTSDIYETLTGTERRTIERYKEAVLEAGSKEVLSLTLYGNRGKPIPARKKRKLNFLIVLRRFSAGFLREYSRIMKRFRSISTPVILTRDMIRTSLNIFPIEFLSMKESYMVIHGEDILGEIDINFSDLRTEIELQIKRRLLRMQEEFLFSLERKADLERLLTSYLISFVPLFKHILRLINRECPVEGTPFREFCDALGLNPEPFFSIWAVKTGEQNFSGDTLTALFEDFMVEMEKLALNLGNLKESDICNL
jgi:hypothetical protein